VRAGAGEFYVLEDNLRVPSGVSYMLENRKMMMRLFPELFATQRIRPVQHYPTCCSRTSTRSRPPAKSGRPWPCSRRRHNSAYFEHAFLAQQMGVELVEGPDLFVQNDTVYMRTTHGPERVHVIYRASTTTFSTRWRSEPIRCSGCPALLGLPRRAGDARQCDRHRRRRRQVDLPYVPEMVASTFEEPILANVPTFLLHRKEDRDYTLAHLRSSSSRKRMARAATGC
jgi:uncharacterized circularly permuted ATP-grasp superfamily protein